MGAGCGVSGILAARLGAARVVLTDYLPAVLRNLRDNVHLNAVPHAVPYAVLAPGEEGSAAAGAGEDAGPSGEAWDPEDASECSDLEEFFGAEGDEEGGGGGVRETPVAPKSWDVVSRGSPAPASCLLECIFQRHTCC